MDPNSIKVDHRAPEKIKRKLLEQIAKTPYPPREILLEFATRMQQDESFRALALTVVREYQQNDERGKKPSKAGGLASRFRKDGQPQQDYSQMAVRLEKKVDLLIVQGQFKPQRSAKDAKFGPIDPVIVRTDNGVAAGGSRPALKGRRHGGLPTVDEGSSRSGPSQADVYARIGDGRAKHIAGGNLGPIDPLIVVRESPNGPTRKEVWPQPRSRI